MAFTADSPDTQPCKAAVQYPQPFPRQPFSPELDAFIPLSLLLRRPISVQQGTAPSLLLGDNFSSLLDDFRGQQSQERPHKATGPVPRRWQQPARSSTHSPDLLGTRACPCPLLGATLSWSSPLLGSRRPTKSSGKTLHPIPGAAQPLGTLEASVSCCSNSQAGCSSWKTPKPRAQWYHHATNTQGWSKDFLNIQKKLSPLPRAVSCL